MGLYQKLLRTVSRQVLLDRYTDDNDPGDIGFSAAARGRTPPDRLLRTPLLFETLEPRVLLSGDPLNSLVTQNALLAGLQSFESWAASNLGQAAQLAQQLPVVSTSVGDLVDLPAQVQTHLVDPMQAYFAANGTSSTVAGLAAYLQADPAEAGAVVGSFAQGEILIALAAFKTSPTITAPLNLTEDSAGVNLQIPAPPTLSGQATVSMALSFGYDTGTTTGATPSFFIQPTTMTESVTLATSGFSGAATLGAADATVTGGAASVTATATVQLKDPLAGDTNNYITPAELTSAPLASLVATSLSGTASLTLPISSSLVAGGPQTLQLNWSGDLAGVGSSNLASLGAWAQLDTISPALLHQAVAALPGLIQAAAGSAGFGAAATANSVLGSASGLGQLFNFGSAFSDAATAAASATSLSQVASALQTALGSPVTFSVNTANNELDMLVQSSATFTDATLPYTIDTQVAGASFTLNGNLSATGTATATLQIGISFDTSQTDANRIVLVESGSLLSLAFDAVTASPIAATAVLGPISVQVNGGSIAVGAQNGNAVDTTKPATVTVGLVSTSGGRVTLAAATANPSTALAAPVSTGLIQTTLPLVSEDGQTTAQVGITWYLNQALGSSNPYVTGGSQAAALLAAPPLASTTLDSSAVAGLQTLGEWATAVSSAVSQTGAFATTMPLLGASLSQLAQLPAMLGAVASAVQSYAVAGASTDSFGTAITSALTTFNAANPGFTISLSPAASQLYAGLIPAADVSGAASLGLPSGADQVVFNLSLIARYSGTQAISLAGGLALDNVTFQSSVPYTSTLLLNLTFGVTLTPGLGPQDATFVRLNQFDASVQVAAAGLSFAAGIGMLGVQVSSGTVALDAEAIAALAGGSGAQPVTISNIIGTPAADLLSVTPVESTLSATLPVQSTFVTFSANSAITLTSGPLSGAAPTVGFAGNDAADLNGFADLTSANLLGALNSVGAALTGVGSSSLLGMDVPLTSLSVGQAANFATEYANDVTGPLTNSSSDPTFSTIQQFVTDTQRAARHQPGQRLEHGRDLSCQRPPVRRRFHARRVIRRHAGQLQLRPDRGRRLGPWRSVQCRRHHGFAVDRRHRRHLGDIRLRFDADPGAGAGRHGAADERCAGGGCAFQPVAVGQWQQSDGRAGDSERRRDAGQHHARRPCRRREHGIAAGAGDGRACRQPGDGEQHRGHRRPGADAQHDARDVYQP